MTTRFSKGARRGWLTLALALVLPAIAAVAAPASAATAVDGCTTTWSTATSGSWTDPTKWSGGTVPVPEDRVCIVAPGSYTVSLPTSVSVATLQVGELPGASGATLEVGVGGDAPVTIASLVTVEGTLRALQPLTIQGPLDTFGTLDLADGATVTQLLRTRRGTLTGCGQLHAQDVQLGDMDSVPGDGCDDPRHGLAVGDGGTISGSGQGDITVWATGVVDLYGGSSPGFSFVLESRVEGPSALRIGGNWANWGRVTILNGRGQPADIVERVPDSTFINIGELAISPLVDGSGHVPSTTTADVAVANASTGTIDSGDPWTVRSLTNEGELFLRVPGLAVEDVFRNRASGVLGHVINDEYPGVPVTVAGSAMLDGTLVTHANDDGTAIGEHHPVLRSGSRTGTFRHHDLRSPTAYVAAYDGPAVDVVRRPSETPLHDLVRAAYDDLLGRSPTPSELSSTVADIQAGRLSQGSLMRRLAASAEHLAFVVDEIFIDALGVHADPAGKAFWVEQLRSRRRTVAQVTASVHGSPAALARADGTTSTWVEQRYLTLLGRPPVGDEQLYWVTRTEAVGRTRVALDLFSSPEARRHRIAELYESMLRRTAAASETAYWAPRLAIEGDIVLVAFIAASPEYRARADLRYP